MKLYDRLSDEHKGMIDEYESKYDMLGRMLIERLKKLNYWTELTVSDLIYISSAFKYYSEIIVLEEIHDIFHDRTADNQIEASEEDERNK
jgi:hypothetical protein